MSDTVLGLLKALLQLSPELIPAVEQIVSDLKSPPQGPLAPVVDADMASPLAKLEGK